VAEGNAAGHAALRLLLHLRRRQQREDLVVVVHPLGRVAVRIALDGAPDPQEALRIRHQTVAPASASRASACL
jgi:hypothetical protein